MDRIRKICLVLGLLLCVVPGTLIGWIIADFVFYIASNIYSWYSPESWLLVGMLVIGIVFIIFSLDIKVVENTD